SPCLRAGAGFTYTIFTVLRPAPSADRASGSDLFRGGHIPELDCLVIATRRYDLAVRAIRQCRTRMSAEGDPFLARFYIPQLDRLPRRGPPRRDGADRRGRHRRVSLEGGPFLAGRHVPQLDRPVLTRRGQRLAVRAERHAVHPLRVSLEGGPFLAGRQVPQ